MKQAKTKELRKLRGKAIDAISLIGYLHLFFQLMKKGVAVGKDKFIADAREVMEEIVNTPGTLSCTECSLLSVIEADDPQLSYFESSWGRIAEALGTAFAPYLQVLMPATLTRAALKPDMHILECKGIFQNSQLILTSQQTSC